MAKVHNLAFEYSEEPELREESKKEPVPKKKHKRASVLGVLGLSVVALALFSALMFGRVEISQLIAEQTTQLEELEKLQSENISLQSELAQKTNMTTVEEYAENELGLHKLDKSQIEYITIDTEDKASVVKNEDENFFVSLKNWFGSMMEYIGL
ncbi:MAG: cell division protein FtsL [Ruminococcus sp.]|nr:cell division protein FtsL [Ruminococcus sp.]